MCYIRQAARVATLNSQSSDNAMSEISRRQFLQNGAVIGSCSSVVLGAGVRAFSLWLQASSPGAPAGSSSEHDRLQPDWYRRKIRQVQQQMETRKLNAMVLLQATNVIYTTGFFHRPTERPLG